MRDIPQSAVVEDGSEKNRIFSYSTLRRLLYVSLAIYGWLLLWIVWLKMNDNESILANYAGLRLMNVKERLKYDLVPFNAHFDRKTHSWPIVLNVILFAPFGVLLPLVFKRQSIIRDVAICFGVSLSLEVLQLFTMIGGFATVDLISNTLGYFIGLGAYHLLFKNRSKRFNVIFFFSVNVLCLGLVVYSIVGTVSSLDVIISILSRTAV